MLTGFMLQTAALPADAPDTTHTRYLAVELSGQAFHVGLGLAHFALDHYTLPRD